LRLPESFERLGEVALWIYVALKQKLHCAFSGFTSGSHNRIGKEQLRLP
jgi:hypothetical protein